MSAERALAAAVHAAVLADAGVQALLGDPARVYDDPPPEPTLPYATIGRVESRSAHASAIEALEHVVTLHVWSRHGGRAEAMDVLGALRDVLDDSTLSVTGRRLVLLLALSSEVFRVGDGRTTQGVLRLRAISEPA